MTSTETTNTYLAGTTKTGTKVHKAVPVGENIFTVCGSGNSALYGRGMAGRLRNLFPVAIGTTPAGSLCKSCFPETV